MHYKVGILGATGRMGIEMSALLADDFRVGTDSLEFSDAVARTKNLVSVDGIPVRGFDEPERELVHVWIDFSRPEGTLELLRRINLPVVIGTTGFSEGQLTEVLRYAEKHPVLLTSNTSPGMNAMMQLLRTNPLTSAQGYDILASELHHRGKKDSPSGTMKSLLKILEDQGNCQIQVQSGRVGDEKGTHTISFFSDDEELTITHRVSNRRVFAKGALLAAHFMAAKKEPGMYSFQDIQNSSGGTL